LPFVLLDFVDLKKINMCRLFLQVTTLSDISCGYGKKYTKAYNCAYDNAIPHQYLWPVQPRPSLSAIQIWRKALRICFPRTERVMDYQLGRWLYCPSTEWMWFFSNHTQLIYQRYGMLWRIWRRSSRAGQLGQTPRFTYETNGLHRPPHSVRATIIRQGPNHLILTGWSNHDNSQPFAFHENCNTDWLLGSTSNPPNTASIRHSIENGSALAVSDGSFSDTRKAGTAGWIIEDSNQAQQLRGTAQSPGSAEAQCSHRSELLGILGIICHINQFCSRHNITNGSVTIGCDGIGAIQSVNTERICKSSHKHFDIIQSIKASMLKSTVQWNFRHVKGHQDDTIHYNDLTRESQLNICTDNMAKDSLQEMIQSEHWERR
jgi:hypothetical protein